MAQVTFCSPALLCDGTRGVCLTAGAAAVPVLLALGGSIVPRDVGPGPSIQLDVSCPAHPAHPSWTSEDVC